MDKDIYTPLAPPVVIWHPAAQLPAPGMAVALRETHFHQGLTCHMSGSSTRNSAELFTKQFAKLYKGNNLQCNGVFACWISDFLFNK